MHASSSLPLTEEKLVRTEIRLEMARLIEVI